MGSFSLTVIVLLFLSVGTATAEPDLILPNVPWRTQKDGENFLLAFAEAISDELQEEGISDLKSLFEALLSLIPQRSGGLSVAKLQVLNMAFASIIAGIVAVEGIGSTEQKMEVVREALIQAFWKTSGFVNPALMKEILSLTKQFCAEMEDNEIDQYLPQQEYSGFINQVGSAGEFESSGSVIAGNTAQQDSTEATQSSSTTTSTTQTYSEQAAASSSLTSTAGASEGSSVFIHHVASLLMENPEFISQYNSIASSGTASTYASASAENVAYSIGQASIASLLAAAVSRDTAGISALAGPSAFVQAFASTVAQMLSIYTLLNLDNAIDLANTFGNSLLTALSSAASAASGGSSAGSQIPTLQTSSTSTGAFALSGAAGSNYAGIGSPLSPVFGTEGGMNNFGFLIPLPATSGVPVPSEISPYSSLISDVLQPPFGLTSSAAKQRISSVMPRLVVAVSENGFNASLFSQALYSLVSQISQSTSLSPFLIFIEAVLEVISALFSILTSAKLGVVSTDSQAATVSSVVQSVVGSLTA